MTDAAAPSTARRRLGVGAVILLILLAFAVTIGIGMFRGATGAHVVSSSPTSTTAPTSGPVGAGTFVHVTGAVRRPGMYRLDAGSRVMDAVARAGGFTGDADRAGVNLARPVADGEQIVVPVVGAPAVAGAGIAADGKLDLNSATVEQLDALPRIGPAMAQRIVAWRDKNGRFTSLDDLLSVPGIGEKMLDAMRDQVRV